MWVPLTLTNKAEIRAFLETDRAYNAYAIGDLEPVLFAECTWIGAARAGRIEALVLHYRGLDPPALLLMGMAEGLRAILAQAQAFDWVYMTCRPEILGLTRAFYTWQEVTRMWRMVLNVARFHSGGFGSTLDVPDTAILAPLDPSHVAQINALFALGGGLAFSPAQVANGVFYGVIDQGALVAVAGTHLVSAAYNMAAIGNVYTHPDYRERGYGTLTTTAVAQALIRRGIREIVLNVAQENLPALRIYERLGFERYCAFLEGPARRIA
jgi:ribosomal protein S18 acetylase RimI-like enzyme